MLTSLASLSARDEELSNPIRRPAFIWVFALSTSFTIKSSLTRFNSSKIISEMLEIDPSEVPVYIVNKPISEYAANCENIE